MKVPVRVDVTMYVEVDVLDNSDSEIERIETLVSEEISYQLETFGATLMDMKWASWPKIMDIVYGEAPEDM